MEESVSVAEAQAASLERLIEQQINLGLKNPHEFFDVLERQLGDDGLLELAKPYLADFVSEMARQKINTKRRSEIAKITTRSLADPQVKLQALWVPDEKGGGLDYKRIADFTADDFDARASYMERMMIGISRHAAWCRAAADAIRDAGVETAATVQLPPLPEIADL